eukprot:TRINITY_DN21684_c0_g1_i3.p1 TRINITY_DN21684_c0_g1~~TRINITY_DN21684_c0_g1_i3.p1  ORF type:complete len:188 (+),score=56.15 TRINITY_DN21684_c0_g1_i3:3-566(+)
MFFFFSSRRRHTRCSGVSWARRCVQETGTEEDVEADSTRVLSVVSIQNVFEKNVLYSLPHVLIVDDNEFNLYALQKIVKKCGYFAQEAYNGRMAVEMVAKQAKRSKFYKIILMDCEMPIMNGYAASKYLRNQMFHKEIPYCPILGCTAFSTDQILTAAIDAGMEGIVTKPISSHDIEEVLKKHCKID